MHPYLTLKNHGFFWERNDFEFLLKELKFFLIERSHNCQDLKIVFSLFITVGFTRYNALSILQIQLHRLA